MSTSSKAPALLSDMGVNRNWCAVSVCKANFLGIGVTGDVGGDVLIALNFDAIEFGVPVTLRRNRFPE